MSKGVIEEFKGIGNLNLNVAAQSDLTEDEQWFVTLGAILSSLEGESINTMDTGTNNKDIRDRLRNRWQVTDEPSLESAILRLAIGERRDIYLNRLAMIQRFYSVINNTNIVFRFICNRSIGFALDWYKTKTKEDLKETVRLLEFDRVKSNAKQNAEFKNMLTDARKWIKLFSDKNLADYQQINSMIGWNAVNLVNLARYGVQVHMIERKDFLKFVTPIKSQVQKAYNSWDEVVVAFIIGCMLWSYSDKRAKAITTILHRFLTHKDSPVHTVKFK